MRKIFILSLILSIFACERKNTTEKIIKGEQVSSFTLRNYKESLLKWKLTGNNAKISDTVLIYQLKLEFFDEKSNLCSKLKADSGYVFQETNNLKALGNVVVQSEDSVILRTDELNWSEKRQKIFTDSKFEYSKGNEIYRGKGLEADPGLKQITIKEEFSGKGTFE